MKVPSSPLTDRDKELLAMPSTQSCFPVVFANNNAWHQLDGYCCGCKKVIEPEYVRGVVARPFPSVAIVEAVGVCMDCQMATRFDYRLHDDMRITALREDGWQTWRPKTTILMKIKSAIIRLFYGKKFI